MSRRKGLIYSRTVSQSFCMCGPRDSSRGAGEGFLREKIAVIPSRTSNVLVVARRLPPRNFQPPFTSDPLDDAAKEDHVREG
jgi:hypothetical protein